jgi:hypothetical protein
MRPIGIVSRVSTLRAQITFWDLGCVSVSLHSRAVFYWLVSGVESVHKYQTCGNYLLFL